MPGTYRLSASRSSGGSTPTAPRHWLSTAAEVEVAGNTTRDVVLPEAQTVTVAVLDAAGNPATAASVSASSNPGSPPPPSQGTLGPVAFSSATTGADGTAVLQVLRGAATELTARPSGSFTFATTATTVPSDRQELRLAAPVPVTGTARFDGLPLAGVRVTVSAGPGRVDALTDGDGRFSVSAPPGPARIAVNRTGLSAPQPTFNVDGPVTIGAEGREIDLDVPAAHVQVRASGMALPTFNANAFAMAPATLGFPFADGVASGHWGRFESSSSNSFATTVLPSSSMTMDVSIRPVVLPIADGDLVVLTQTVADDRAPSIRAVLSPEPNEHGWSAEDTTVSFVCSDDLDPDPTCPSPVRVSEESADHVVHGITADRAGNRGRIAVPVRIDRDAPSIDARSSASEAPAWTNGDVRVAFDCTDALSGIAECTDDVVLTGEGVGLQAAGAARDRAGHVSGATATFNIDRTAPTIEASGFDPDRWTNAASVTFTCADALSGVASCPAPIDVADEGEHLFEGTASDVAGNTASASGVVRIDRTAPTAVPQYPAGMVMGWYAAPVSVPLRCSDGLSGVVSCDTTDFTQPGMRTQHAAAVDRAGNRTTVPVTVGIDPEAPKTTIAPKTVALGTDRYVVGTASDALSGVKRVVVRFTGVLGTLTIVEADVTCDTGGCTWAAKVPARPDRYNVRAKAFDTVGNVDASPASTDVIGLAV